MSAHKHTPGEWHAGGSHKCTIYDKFGQRLANSFEGVMAAQRTDSECAANARLIAAAPELLDLARAIYRATNEGLVVNNSHEDSVGVLFDAAQEVIAKATGEPA